MEAGKPCESQHSPPASRVTLMPRALLDPPAVADLSSLPIGWPWLLASWLLIGLKAPSGGGGLIEKRGGETGQEGECLRSLPLAQTCCGFVRALKSYITPIKALSNGFKGKPDASRLH
ncbi:unnamed protein product [Lota lota]